MKKSEKTGDQLLEERLVSRIHSLDKQGKDEEVIQTSKTLCREFPNNPLSKKLIAGNPAVFKGPNRFVTFILRMLVCFGTIHTVRTAYNAQKKINSKDNH